MSPDPDVTADHPLASVFERDGTRTYVAYNDGQSSTTLDMPAGEMATTTVPVATPTQSPAPTTTAPQTTQTSTDVSLGTSTKDSQIRVYNSNATTARNATVDGDPRDACRWHHQSHGEFLLIQVFSDEVVSCDSAVT